MQAENAEPAHETRRPRRWRWTVLGLVVILGGILAVVIWQATLSLASSADQYHRPSPPVSLPAAYYEVTEAQIAQGLNLSISQVTAEIEADPNEGLFGVATAHGVAPERLYTIEIAALQAASDDVVASGAWTQAQADSTMEYWRQRGAKALGSDMTSWFIQH